MIVDCVSEVKIVCKYDQESLKLAVSSRRSVIQSDRYDKIKCNLWNVRKKYMYVLYIKSKHKWIWYQYILVWRIFFLYIQGLTTEQMLLIKYIMISSLTRKVAHNSIWCWSCLLSWFIHNGNLVYQRNSQNNYECLWIYDRSMS